MPNRKPIRKKVSRQLISAKSVPRSSQCLLQIRVFDGTRNPFPDGTDVLYRVINANQKEIVQEERDSAVLNCEFEFHDNFLDAYTVIVFSDGYRQAGVTPVALSPSVPTTLDLMLIPNDGRPNFADATWNWIKTNLPFLGADVSETGGKTRYGNLIQNKTLRLAGLLNITTAMKEIHLPEGSPLDFLRQLKWDDTFAQDRFFAYCEPKLLDQVRIAAAQGLFARETGSAFFHPGATASFKQIQFGE